MRIINWLVFVLAIVLVICMIGCRQGWIHSSYDDFQTGLILVGLGHQFILAKDIGFLKGKAHTHDK